MDRTAEADTEEGMSDSRDAGSTAKIPKQNVETLLQVSAWNTYLIHQVFTYQCFPGRHQ